MRRTLILVSAILLSACFDPTDDETEKIMDEVERQLKMPEGAQPLQQYARHYAYNKDGQVLGIYVLRTPTSSGKVDQRPADYGCEEIVASDQDLRGDPVACEPERDSGSTVAAGHRRWFKSYSDLPFINDGGCAIVKVSFNPATRQLNHAFCNGEA